MTVDISRPATTPEKASSDGLEQRSSARWESDNTYAFRRGTPRSEVFAIDTPPPTVSGSLHIGSVFGYVQADSIARYHRMLGQNVFYPMGWDDNGLPTERRVENFYGVRCDTSLPYDPEFTPPAEPDPKKKIACSRRNFVELCKELTEVDEKVFEDVWRAVGLSVDWSLTYATIGERAQRASQRMFLRNLSRGEAYLASAPTFWDVTFQTAVAQAEFEERETDGAGHNIYFRRAETGENIEIFTTRPELLAATGAVVINPEHPRADELVGQELIVPAFGQRVKVYKHALALLDKGTGMAMVSTFGDITDVTWWRELQIEMRAIVGRDGRIVETVPNGLSQQGQDNFHQIVGLKTKQARAAVVEMMRAEGTLKNDPTPIRHAVKYYEKGDQPLEIVTSMQWYIKNGGRETELRDQLIARGRELNWHPEGMRRRYEDWVNGLNGDWLVSRQRYFGVPFPVWYRVDANGNIDRSQMLLPQESQLPIDPSSDVPDGFTDAQRNQPGGFAGDPDVMDTWVTSSMTPHIAGGWEDDPELFAQVFPMDMRPQGPEIIRTWLFVTALRSQLEHQSLPWTNACINGWVLDPDRKKMSKSKGNVTTPMDLVVEHGADAVRYWACSARPGTDTAFDVNAFKEGRRLTIKLLNASKMVLAIGQGTTISDITEPLDLAMLARLRQLVAESRVAFDDFDYARVLEKTESFFWNFCDNQLEIVKSRAYGDGAAAKSAQAALRLAIAVLQRQLAPFVPFTADEVWSWWQDGSIHTASWPTVDEFVLLADTLDNAPVSALESVENVLAQVRRAKTEAKVSMKTAVQTLQVSGTAEMLDALRLGEGDLCGAGGVEKLVYVDQPESTSLGVAVTLAPVE
jgi:valyl-tRNA synthetase